MSFRRRPESRGEGRGPEWRVKPGNEISLQCHSGAGRNPEGRAGGLGCRVKPGNDISPQCHSGAGRNPEGRAGGLDWASKGLVTCVITQLRNYAITLRGD